MDGLFFWLWCAVDVGLGGMGVVEGPVEDGNQKDCAWDIDMKSGDHQLRLVVYPIIYKVLYILGGAGFQPSTVLVMVMVKKMMIKIDEDEDDEILFTRSNIAKRHH